MEKLIFKYNVKEDGEDYYLTPKTSHTETLIWLHGLGDTAQGFFPIFSSNLNPCFPTTKIVLLTAPIRPVTINMGMSFHSWYDIRDLRFDPSNFEKAVSLTEVNDSIERVNKVIEKEAEILKGDYKKIAVGGFSQGCSISLSCGLQFNKSLGAIIGLSGVLFPNVVINKENEKTPILLSHGKLDPLIPCAMAEKSYQKLDKKINNFKLLIDENLDHGLGQDSLKWMREFWSEVFKN